MPVSGHSGNTIDLGSSRYAGAALLVDQNGDPLSVGGSGGTSSTDDGAFTAGASSLTPVGGIVTADSVDSGDAGAFAMLANRQQKVTLYDSSGNELAVGGGTQYTEDAAAAANPVGTMLILRRKDTLSTTEVSADGDNIAGNATSKGELHVKHADAISVTGTVTVDGSGVTQPVSNAGLTELAAAIFVDDAAYTPGTSSALVIGAQADETAPDAVDEGDAGALRMTLSRGLHVNLRDASGAEVSVGGGTQYDEDTAHVSGDKLTMAGVVRADTAAAQSGTDGDRTVLISDGSGRLHVNVGNTVTVGSHAVTNAGTFAVQDATAQASLSVLDDWDESDRAKVNPIAGQAGVAGGSGTVSALTQRVVLATDVALPAGTNNVGDIDIETFEPSADVTMQNAATATGNGTVLTVTGYGTASLQVTGTFVGTITWEGSTDGTNFVSILATQGSAVSIATTATTTGIYRLSVAGLTTIRARISAYTSGSITVVGRATNAPFGTKVVAVSGSVITSNGGTFAVQESGAALTALQLIDDTVATLGTTTYTETTTKGLTVGAVRRDADTTLVDTTNEIGPLQMDANGRLKVEAFSGETLPVSLATVPSHAVTNAGTFAVQVDGSALTALQKIDDPVLVDDAAFTPATSSVMMAGFEADETATDSVDEGDAGAARMTLTRKLIVTPQPHTAGGCTPFYNIDVDETEDAIKASAGQLYELYLFNATTAPLYVKLYDATVANVTVGTTTPVMTIPVPANADSDGAGVVRNWPNGIAFANAITIAATTAAADNDTGAPAANAVMASGAYA